MKRTNLLPETHLKPKLKTMTGSHANLRLALQSALHHFDAPFSHSFLNVIIYKETYELLSQQTLIKLSI